MIYIAWSSLGCSVWPLWLWWFHFRIDYADADYNRKRKAPLPSSCSPFSFICWSTSLALYYHFTLGPDCHSVCASCTGTGPKTGWRQICCSCFIITLIEFTCTQGGNDQLNTEGNFFHSTSILKLFDYFHCCIILFNLPSYVSNRLHRLVQDIPTCTHLHTCMLLLTSCWSPCTQGSSTLHAQGFT